MNQDKYRIQNYFSIPKKALALIRYQKTFCNSLLAECLGVWKCHSVVKFCGLVTKPRGGKFETGKHLHTLALYLNTKIKPLLAMQYIAF